MVQDEGCFEEVGWRATCYGARAARSVDELESARKEGFLARFVEDGATSYCILIEVGL